MVPYGTDLLLEPYGFATIQFFYNANKKTAPVRERIAVTPVRKRIRFFFLVTIAVSLDLLRRHDA